MDNKELFQMRKFEDEQWSNFHKTMNKLNFDLVKKMMDLETRLNKKFENVFRTVKEKFSSIEQYLENQDRRSSSMMTSATMTPLSMPTHFNFSTHEDNSSSHTAPFIKKFTNTRVHTPSNQTMHTLSSLREPGQYPTRKDLTLLNTSLTDSVKLRSIRGSNAGIIPISIEKFRKQVQEDFNFFENNQDLNEERDTLNDQKKEMMQAIRDKQNLEVKDIIEYCFQQKKVGLLDTAILDQKNHINRDVEEGNIINWMINILNSITKMQLQGNGDTSVLTDLKTELINKQEVFQGKTDN